MVAGIRLRQTFGANAGRVAEIPGPRIRLGRMPDCEFPFDPQRDLDASGYHAEIVRDAAGYRLLDTGSKNGTWVNGVRVADTRLKHGDEIECGTGGPRVRVELDVDASSKAAAQPRSPTMPMSQVAPFGAARGDANTMLAHEAGASPFAPSSFDPAAIGATPQPAAQAPFGAAAPQSGPFPPASPRVPGPFSASPAPGSFSASALAPSRPSPGPFPPSGPSGPFPPPAGGAPAAQPLGDKRYGQRTVGMMIQAAVAQAQHGAPKQGSRTLPWVAFGCTALLLVGVMIAGGAYYVSTRDDGSDVATTAENPSATPSAPVPSRSGNARGLIDAIGPGVFHIAQERSETRVCQGVAVRSTLLASTRECIDKIVQLRRNGVTTTAISRPGSAPLALGQTWTDPERGVGLVELRGEAGTTVTLASTSSIDALALGEPVFAISFPAMPPGTRSDVQLGSGAVSRFLSDLEAARSVNAGESLYIEHTAPGGSGAPLVTTGGEVVGILSSREYASGTMNASVRADGVRVLLERIGR